MSAVKEKTITLDALYGELMRRQESKIDAVVDTRRISFYTGPNGSTLHFDDPAAPDGQTGGPVTSHALGQISDRLGIPKKYFDRMRAEAPTLLDANVAHWFYNQPETRMVRMLDGNVRAVLSDRYRRLDDLDLVTSLLPVFESIDGLEFHVAALTDTKLYIRAILPRLEGEITVGDIVQAGVAIRNSEVGSGALVVEPFIWRLACLNGMTIPDRRLRKYHVGRKVEETEEVYGIYRDETLAADDRAFFLKVGDLVRNALSEAAFEAIVGDLRAAADPSTAVENPVKATERLAQSFTLTGDEQAAVLRNLTLGGNLTRWGMANAITAAAKEADDFDRQAEMEQFGYEAATLSQAEWAKVAVAA